MRKIVLLATCLSAISAGAFAQGTPQADPDAAANPPIAEKKSDLGHDPARGANSFTEVQARSRIRRAGFRAVSPLTLDANGLWQGTAIRRGETVHVALDYKGDVTTN